MNDPKYGANGIVSFSAANSIEGIISPLSANTISGTITFSDAQSALGANSSIRVVDCNNLEFKTPTDQAATTVLSGENATSDTQE